MKRWVKHLHRPEKQSTGHPWLRYKGVVKRDIKGLNMDTRSLEDLAENQSRWRATHAKIIKSGEEKLVYVA